VIPATQTWVPSDDTAVGSTPTVIVVTTLDADTEDTLTSRQPAATAAHEPANRSLLRAIVSS
jgi:hypothetical protein